MQTVIAKREMVGNKKVITLDSDCQFNIDAINESIMIINKYQADYGLLTLWGVELAITPEDDVNDVFNSFKQLVQEERSKTKGI